MRSIRWIAGRPEGTPQERRHKHHSATEPAANRRGVRFPRNTQNRNDSAGYRPPNLRQQGMTSATYMARVGPFFYIGSTTNLRRRRDDHRWRLKTGIHPSKKLQAAYGEHGTCDVMPLEFFNRKPNSTDEEHRHTLRTAEQKLLNRHANDPNLCNTSMNAFGPESQPGMIALRKTPEYRARMREAALRQPPPTAETRERMSAAKRGQSNPKARAVTVTTPDGTTQQFPCVADAARFFQTSQQCMDQWLKGTTAWPGTGARTLKKNQWIAQYRAAFADA